MTPNYKHWLRNESILVLRDSKCGLKAFPLCTLCQCWDREVNFLHFHPHMSINVCIHVSEWNIHFFFKSEFNISELVTV